MKTQFYAHNILTIENFWSAQQCDEFIRYSEQQGFAPASVETERGPRVVDHIRNNLRLIFTDLALAEKIWSQLEPHAPRQIGASHAIGLNERFRVYKYLPGQQFRKHRDQSYIRNSEEASFFTFMIYLNDDFNGGETTFKDLRVAPRKGAALIFYHQLEHEGSAVIEGTKYVLRSDIMYRLKN